MIKSNWARRLKQLYTSVRFSGLYYRDVYDDLDIAALFIREHIVQEAECLGLDKSVLSNPALYVRLETAWLESFGK
jgi:hypothetical protein